MSQNIVFIFAKGADIFSIEDCLKNNWIVRKVMRPNEQFDLQVQEHDGIASALKYVNIGEMQPQEEVENEYKNDDIFDEGFRTSLLGHKFYSVTFNDLDLCNRVVEKLLKLTANLENCWVDNGYGKAIRADTALKNILANPQWDWQ